MPDKPYWPPYRRPGAPLPTKAVTRAEIAEYLGVGIDTVHWMARRGHMPEHIGFRPTSRSTGGNGRPIKVYDLRQVCEMRGKMNV